MTIWSSSQLSFHEPSDSGPDRSQKGHSTTWPMIGYYVYEDKVREGLTGEHKIYLFWHISLVDNVHFVVSDMTDEKQYEKVWVAGKTTRDLVQCRLFF